MEATKTQAQEVTDRVVPVYSVSTPCYALYCGPRREKDAVFTKVFGTRSVNVRVFPQGGIWRRHTEQLRSRYGAQEDADPGEELPVGSREPFSVPPNMEVVTSPLEIQAPPVPAEELRIPAQPKRQFRNLRLPTGEDYT